MILEFISVVGVIGGFAYLGEKVFHYIHKICDAITGGDKNGTDDASKSP